MKAASRPLPSRWRREERAVRAVQVAFDVGEEVQLLLRREAAELGISPADRVRQLLGLAVARKPKRPRLTVSLTSEDFQELAGRFGVEQSDRRSIRRLAAEQVIKQLRPGSA